MAKLTTVEVQKGGGGGFGAPDTSDNLEDMTNYEKALLYGKVEIKEGVFVHMFEALAQVKVMTKDTDKSKYEYVKMDASDIPDLTAKSMGAAGHAINSEFAALEIPFRAIPFASKDAVKVEKTVKKGKNVGITKSVKETDCLKIYRTGEDFDVGLYATEDSGRENDKGEPLVYENYTVGQKLRADKWLAEVAVEEIDEKVLNAIGIEVN